MIDYIAWPQQQHPLHYPGHQRHHQLLSPETVPLQPSCQGNHRFWKQSSPYLFILFLSKEAQHKPQYNHIDYVVWLWYARKKLRMS
jgi:hypothetical protein